MRLWGLAGDAKHAKDLADFRIRMSCELMNKLATPYGVDKRSLLLAEQRATLLSDRTEYFGHSLRRHDNRSTRYLNPRVSWQNPTQLAGFACVSIHTTQPRAVDETFC